ncbi:hypothetical protein KDK95_27700 [Actinospica sp. MGRD01-02]|uniref:Uncharacterized protein n=1 Tax=Actinospica acidithermotolerans TaxID=2828514 RepID=A0A941EM82_9ACTN|nr:hypothetical protein [Actinospica acidithermotolerans]MBR7830119.1 hypothetical protein [Actinospica acidithermotolerans]
MSYPTGTLLPRSKFARENVAKGKVEGVAESVLRVLDRRGIELTPAAREHIAACEDVEIARTWLDEAVTAANYTDLTGLDAL